MEPSFEQAWRDDARTMIARFAPGQVILGFVEITGGVEMVLSKHQDAECNLVTFEPDGRIFAGAVEDPESYIERAVAT